MNLNLIKSLVHEAATKAGFDAALEKVHVEKTKNLEHGHFASNIAMILAKSAGKNPREVAEAIISNLENENLEKVEIAGPGFINLFMSPAFFQQEFKALVENTDDYLKDVLGFTPEAKTMAIDTSHPNIAKPMGVHHLLSTIIGASIVNIYKKAGWKVVNDNYLGDYGTQFGKLIHAIKTWGDQAKIEANPIDELQALYVKFHEEVENDDALEDKGRAEFKKLEEGDAENRELWQKIKEWSMMEFNEMYDRLGVKFDYINGESTYEDKMEPILEAGRKSGVIEDGEGGAWIIKAEDPDAVPIMVRKSDGATLYMTRDLARVKYWDNEWNPDIMVNVVDVAQSLYFKQLEEARQKLGLTDAPTIHVDFGRMQFPDGAMSTRKGNIIKLIDVLDEAEERALKLVQEKGAELSEEEQKDLASVMGIGAIKYNILSQNRVNNITFDWDKMLAFEGNSAPYLMYTYTRTKSVLEKADSLGGDLNPKEPQELALALQLLMLPDALQRAEEEFKPNHIANYLYELTQLYNTMYNALPILKAEDEARMTRLALTNATGLVLKEGLALLGIEVPKKM